MCHVVTELKAIFLNEQYHYLSSKKYMYVDVDLLPVFRFRISVSSSKTPIASLAIKYLDHMSF